MPNLKTFIKCLSQNSNLECLSSNPSLINSYEKKALSLQFYIQSLAHNKIQLTILLFHTYYYLVCFGLNLFPHSHT